MIEITSGSCSVGTCLILLYFVAPDDQSLNPTVTALLQEMLL